MNMLTCVLATRTSKACVLGARSSMNILNGSINRTRTPLLNPSVITTFRQNQTSSKTEDSSASVSSRFPGFTPVFNFPYIRVLRFACRLKLYQTLLTCCSIPVGLNLMSNGILTPPTLGMLAGFAGLSLVMLGALGELCRKIVGILYFNRTNKQVVISHFTFFGNRTDTILDLEDIVPINETPETIDEIYWKIHTYTGRTFYVSTRQGGLLDHKRFLEIFGDPKLGYKK